MSFSNWRDPVSRIHVKDICSFCSNHNLKPEFSQPQEICSFAIDKNGTRIPNGKSQLRRYARPALPINLKEGYDSYIPKGDGPVGLERVLDTSQKLSEFEFKHMSFSNWRDPVSRIHVKDICSFCSNHNLKPEFSQPQEICSFAIDKNGTRIPNGKSQLRRYARPALPINLKEGYDSYIPKGDGPVGLERVLDTIRDARIELRDVHIVSYRNNLNKILETPFSRNAWSIGVRKSAGVPPDF
eukprot:TRINITY_DN585_c0_g1_i1.p1 TRINITY_DN585_c0_g1~~TRINITY_DN585_c0_g1_i1.p1  ORF type:complete len:259 (-),score=33.43 TRINITY_DN585_c0_g1_i1:32-754(-)